MPNAKKLPSGSWNCLAYSHTDKNGKRIYKSFTAPTKAQAELLAAEYKTAKKGNINSKITIIKALEGYITAKTAVLSPSTIREYIGMKDRYFEDIGGIKIERFTNEKMQLFISDLAGKVSPKTVKNIYGLLMSAILFYDPTARFNVSLPPVVQAITSAPSDKDIQDLFNAASDKLKVCIALAAFGSLRRGEISALKYKDLSGNVVSVHSDMVKSAAGKWILKDHPKTSGSVRSVALPGEIVNLLGTGDPEEFIVKWPPDYITKHFIKLRNKQGINIRFHDMRHYFASIGAVLSIPAPFLKSFGGWTDNSKVFSETYQNKIIPLSEHYSNIMTDHFSNLIDGKKKNAR